MVSSEGDRSLDSTNRARAAIVALSTALVSVAVLAWIGWSRSGGAGDGLIALGDDDVHRDVVEELVAGSAGIWDSFPDPDVGRVLQPGLQDRPNGLFEVSSNSRGVREREWEVPKPPGRVRVVVLGDSFVFGNGVRPEERLAQFLEDALIERGSQADVECLSIGMAAWNLTAECAFLRRQITDLAPDLVVHVTVSNDLDDNPGVRGFGALARFTSAHRVRANGFITTAHPFTLGFKSDSLLEAGLDWESLSRYEQAADDMLELAELVETSGGHYLTVVFWPGSLPIAARQLEARLGESRCAYVPSAFRDSFEHRISANDKHWNRAGNELVAQMVYGLIQERDLLPSLQLPQWQRAQAAVQELHVPGSVEAKSAIEDSRLLAGRVVRAAIDFSALDEVVASQVHGGIGRNGLVAPYGSLLLANEGAENLHLVGAHLDRPELHGKVRVHLDEVEVAVLEQIAGQPVDERIPIPAELADRAHLTVRFVIDDWVYDRSHWGACVGFRLDRVSLGF